MTSERDPMLQSLFDEARQDFADPEFTAAIFDRINKRKRDVQIFRVAILVLIVLIEVLLESPLRNSLGMMVDVLDMDLFAVGDGWVGFFVAPLNSLAGLVGMILLGVNLLFRRLFQ